MGYEILGFVILALAGWSVCHCLVNDVNEGLEDEFPNW